VHRDYEAQAADDDGRWRQRPDALLDGIVIADRRMAISSP
jgi:hypothetical protein